jgi:hypothetical protein
MTAAMQQADSEQRVSTILRLAWSDFPLHAIRAIVERSIAGLQQLAPEDILGRPLGETDLCSESDPVQEALATCSDGLREGCGLPREASVALRQHRMRTVSAAWSETYSHALRSYQDAASVALERAFSELARR